MGESRVNEQILMKLAEAEKKSGLTEMQRAMLGGAIGAASGWSLGGVLFNSPATRKQVAAAAGAGALLGLGDTALRKRLRRQAASAALQKEAAYGDAVKTLGRKVLGAAEDTAIDKFLQSKTRQDFRRAALRIDAIRAADRFVRENAKGITTGALTVGTSGALAGARALIMRQREQEKTASYHAVREMLGLGKEASQAPDGTQATQQEISKRRRHQALEDTILENPRVKFRDLPPLQQAGSMAGGYYGAKKLLKARRGNTWSPAADAILGAAIGSSVGNLLGAIATDATIRHEERASQKRK
jgi:membrane protein YqaA with SNARE-associated domain